mgnify:CR=1 FL=1
MTTPATTFERETLRHIAPMTAALQALAASLCLIAQVLMDVVQGQFHPWHFVWPVLAFGGAALTRRVTTMRQLFLVGLFNVQTVVIGFAVLTRLADDPGFWFLPIGLCVTLTTATIYHRVQDFVFGSGLTWVTLSLIVQPVLDSGVKQVFVPVIIIGSMLAGVASSVLFRSYRSQSYRAQRQLHQSANMDPLTELPNRRAFTESWKRLQQSATEPLVFMMADIDNFKRINDDFGHDVGDKALIEVAKVLKAMPESVSVARLGGEEFAVLCAANRDQANALAAQLVGQVNQQFVSGRRMSISVGVAMQKPDETSSDVMRRADEALYLAKVSGKNRAAWASA